MNLLLRKLSYNFNDARVGILGGKFDNFIIVMYLNQVAVGAYSFCLTITHMLERLMPMQYFIAVIRPAFFSVAVAMDNKRINKFYQIMLKVTYVFYFPVLVFLLVSQVSHPLIIAVYCIISSG